MHAYMSDPSNTDDGSSCLAQCAWMRCLLEGVAMAQKRGDRHCVRPIIHVPHCWLKPGQCQEYCECQHCHTHTLTISCIPYISISVCTRRGEENVSVIVAPIFEGFTLQSLGSAEASARTFLGTIAPEGSGKVAALIGASQRCVGACSWHVLL